MEAHTLPAWRCVHHLSKQLPCKPCSSGSPEMRLTCLCRASSWLSLLLCLYLAKLLTSCVGRFSSASIRQQQQWPSRATMQPCAAVCRCVGGASICQPSTASQRVVPSCLLLCSAIDLSTNEQHSGFVTCATNAICQLQASCVIEAELGFWRKRVPAVRGAQPLRGVWPTVHLF